MPPALGGTQILGAVSSLLCRELLHREHWSLVLTSTWHTARVGSDHSGTAHTGFMGVRALPCGLDYVLFPLRLFGGDGFSDVLTAYGPSSLAATFLVSSTEEYSYAEFSGRPFRKRSRIHRHLVRQWLHVCVSSRGAWFDGAVNCGCLPVAFHRRSSTSLWCRRDSSPWSCLFGKP